MGYMCIAENCRIQAGVHSPSLAHVNLMSKTVELCHPPPSPATMTLLHMYLTSLYLPSLHMNLLALHPTLPPYLVNWPDPEEPRNGTSLPLAFSPLG